MVAVYLVDGVTCLLSHSITDLLPPPVPTMDQYGHRFDVDECERVRVGVALRSDASPKSVGTTQYRNGNPPCQRLRDAVSEPYQQLPAESLSTGDRLLTHDSR